MTVQGEHKRNGKPYWLLIALALIVPSGTFLIGWGALGNRIDVLAQASEATKIEMGGLDNAYVPRREIDAKLQNLELQVES